ncbi:MAG: hypothetical protein AB7V77_02000 [Candidatus Woesearchaeota archaeon]
MAKQKNKDNSIYLYFIIMILIVIIFILTLKIMNTPVVSENEELDTTITIVDLEEEKEDIIEDNITSDNETNDTMAYAKGCWCPGAIADYWSNDCDCNVQEAINVIEKDK